MPESPSFTAATPNVSTPPSGMPEVFRLLLLFAGGLAAYVMYPFRISVFLAAVLAATAYPLHDRTCQALSGKRHLSALLVSLLLLIVLIAPCASIVAYSVQEVTVGLEWLRDTLGLESLRDFSWAALPLRARRGLDTTLRYFHISHSDLQGYVAAALGRVQGAAPAVVSTSLNVVSDALLMLVAFFFFLVDGRNIVLLVGRLSPLSRAQTDELIVEFGQVSSAALLGSAATAALQALIIGGTFAIAGVPHNFFFALVTLLAAFIPVVGATLVWAPVAAIIGFGGSPGKAIALAAGCAVAISIADHVIKPMLTRGKAAIHTGLMFFALLGGLSMFGMVGVIAGPLIIAFFIALLRMYERDFHSIKDVSP